MVERVVSWLFTRTWLHLTRRGTHARCMWISLGSAAGRRVVGYHDRVSRDADVVASQAVIEREEGDGRTVVGDVLLHAGYAEIATLFAMHYDELRAEHAARSAPGLLAFDLGSALITAKMWTKTRPEAINAITVGRHRECDVCLARDPSISLRHLAVITHPFDPAGGGNVSFRILDLRTNLAFADCFGQRMQGVIADGGAIFVIGRYAMLLLPTGDGTRLPDSATVSFSSIADPLYLDPQARRPLLSGITELRPNAGGAANDGGPAHRPEAQLAADDDLHRTSLSVIEGPTRASAGLLGTSEEPLGTLEISAEGQSRKLVVGARAASQGLLLGCYERCDDDRLSHLKHHSISRVHLLVWLHGETLYAIDTASTNGTFVHRDKKRVRTRMVRLASGLEVVLADDRARLIWRSLD
jgi:hypothetical protein